MPLKIVLAEMFEPIITHPQEIIRLKDGIYDVSQVYNNYTFWANCLLKYMYVTRLLLKQSVHTKIRNISVYTVHPMIKWDV